jgi:Putative lumazine-binding
MKFLALLFMLCSGLVQAQTGPEGQAIMKPINALFKGMNLGDSAMVHSAFTDDAAMASIGKDKAGKVYLKRESSIAGFLKAVGTPHTETWSEPIWDARIEVDGDLAQVWTRYAFYRGKKFSHCGVDAFQLVKQNGVWKIFHLADTRQTENCDVPKSISDQFK